MLSSTYDRASWCLFIGIAVAITATFGAALAGYFHNLGALDGAGQMLLMAGSGWVVEIILGSRLSRHSRAYLFLLGEIMVVGVVLLIPFAILQLLQGPLWIGWPILSVLLSSATMTFLHYRGVKSLELPSRLSLRWFFSLQITALAWVLFFTFHKSSCSKKFPSATGANSIRSSSSTSAWI